MTYVHHCKATLNFYPMVLKTEVLLLFMHRGGNGEPKKIPINSMVIIVHVHYLSSQKAETRALLTRG